MQQYKNHTQIAWSYYLRTLLPSLILLVGAIVNLVHSARENVYSASLIILIAVILISFVFAARGLALKAQDRAIRAEENLRYYMLTGKRMDARLTIGQVIALRFASDEELPLLYERALKESLSNKDIKKEIKNWRPDEYRV